MNFISKIKEKVKKKKKGEQKEDLSQDYDIFIERPKLNIFVKLYYIIIKNLHLIIRSKLSALIFIVGPLLIVFLAALAFNTSTLYDINVAVYSDAYSEISNGITTDLEGNLYNVIKLNSEEDCIEAVKFQDFQVCLIFPPNMVLDNSANNNIKIYVDNSRLNVANLISNQISTKVSVESVELSTELVTQILTVVDNANKESAQAKGTLTDLVANNDKNKVSISSLSSNLDGLDLSFSAVDTAVIYTEIENIRDDNNLSSGEVSDLKSLIDSLDSSYDTAISKIESAESGVGAASDSVPSITNSLNTASSQLDSINQNLNSITTQIETIKVTNVESIVSPIKTSIEPLSSRNNYLLFILPSILVVLIMFVTLLMSSSSIIQEKTSQAYFRNFITPTNENLFMAGEFLSNFFVLLFQVAVIMSVLYYFLQDLGVGTFVLAGSMLMLVGTFFIILGMFIGYVLNTKPTVTIAALSTGIIMLFFSNTIIPLETLSVVTREVVFYNPFLLGENMLKKIFLFGAGFKEISEFAYILIGFSIAVLIGAVLARRLSRHFFNIR